MVENSDFTHANLQNLQSLLAAPAECALSEEQIDGLIQTWLNDFDRGAKMELLENNMTNQMHIFGMGLCCLLSEHNDRLNITFELKHFLNQWVSKLILTDQETSKFEIEDIHNVVCALQLHFEQFYTRHRNKYVCELDMRGACVWLLTQIGHWLRIKYKVNMTKTTEHGRRNVKEKADEVNMPDAALRGFVEIQSDDFCVTRIDAVVFLLDALHSIFSLHNFLIRAEIIHNDTDLVELTGHHKEASAEVFFLMSITSDCMPGSITQYSHKFAYLFHSISQVIYYNFPTYNRQRQLNLQELQGKNVCAANILPLLTELRPDIPVVYEHTAAGYKAYHETQKWSWVLWSHYVFLVDQNMRVFMADDVRELLKLCIE